MAECERCLEHDKVRQVRELIFCTTHLAMWELEGRDADDNEVIDDMPAYKQLCARLGHLKHGERDLCDCERALDDMHEDCPSTNCAKCQETLDMSEYGEGGHIYPDGSVLCATCEGGTND